MKRTVLLLTTLVLLAPLAASHAAGPPREFETRLLHDHNDDSAVVLAGQHGFDSIALDVREGHTASGAPALILRLLLNGGCSDTAPDACGTLTQTVRFEANGAEHEVAFQTDDGGTTWYGPAGFYSAPESLNDGTRFAVEGWIALADYGLASGTETSQWFVDATDAMPQGIVPGVPDPLGAAFDIGTYSVGAPGGYIELTASKSNLLAKPGDRVQVNVSVANLVTLAQPVAFTLSGATNDAPGLSLPPNAAQDIQLNATAGAASSDIVLVATTPLGGYATLTIPIEVESVEEGAFSSPDIPSGSSWSHTFRTTGVFAYHNHHMAEVGGKVHIDAAPANGTTHTIRWTGTAFDPESLDVALGDTVTWINDGPGPMQVMGGVTADGSDPLAHDHGDHETPDEGIPGPAFVILAVSLLAVAVRLRRQ